MAACIFKTLALATFAVAVTIGTNLSGAFNSGAYSCVEVPVSSGSDLDKAKRHVLDDLLDSTTPERNAYCATSTVGEGHMYGYASCDTSKLTHCDDCLSYAQDFLDNVCEYSIGGQVVVGDGVCAMQFDARPISQCAS